MEGFAVAAEDPTNPDNVRSSRTVRRFWLEEIRSHRGVLVALRRGHDPPVARHLPVDHLPARDPRSCVLQGDLKIVLPADGQIPAATPEDPQDPVLVIPAVGQLASMTTTSSKLIGAASRNKGNDIPVDASARHAKAFDPAVDAVVNSAEGYTVAPVRAVVLAVSQEIPEDEQVRNAAVPGIRTAEDAANDRTISESCF